MSAWNIRAIAIFILLLLLLPPGVAHAHLPPLPQKYAQISGVVRWGTWRGPVSAEEIWLDRNGSRSEAKRVSSEASWYLVLEEVAGLPEGDVDFISDSLGGRGVMSGMFHRYFIEKRKGRSTLLVVIPGPAEMKISVGDVITMKDVVFQHDDEDGGILKIGELVVKPGQGGGENGE